MLVLMKLSIRTRGLCRCGLSSRGCFLQGMSFVMLSWVLPLAAAENTATDGPKFTLAVQNSGVVLQ